jgi:hypothetical protein
MLNLNCKNVQHVKIYLPCNFEENPITHFGVISIFSLNFQNFNTFHPSYQHSCKKNINVNDSQNLAFATSHFVIELLRFDYLSNQKQ